MAQYLCIQPFGLGDGAHHQGDLVEFPDGAEPSALYFVPAEPTVATQAVDKKAAHIHELEAELALAEEEGQ